MVRVERKERESLERLLRRFNKKLQQTGAVRRIRGLQFYKPPKNKRARKEEALRRAEITKKKEYLKKLGIVDVEQWRKALKTQKIKSKK